MGLFDFLKQKAPRTDMNRLIFNFAEYHRDSDRKEIESRLSEIRLFVPATKEQLKDSKNGEKRVVKQGDNFQIPTHGISGQKLLSFLINQDDRRLGNHYIEISMLEVMKMIEMKLPEIYGFLFWNNDKSYFGFAKTEFSRVRLLLETPSGIGHETA